MFTRVLQRDSVRMIFDISSTPSLARHVLFRTGKGTNRIEWQLETYTDEAFTSPSIHDHLDSLEW